MTTYAWPSAVAPFVPSTMDWWWLTNSRTSVSTLNGNTQTIALPGNRWACRLAFGAQPKAQRAQLRALITRLNGAEHRLQLWHLAEPTRLGTCNTTGVTVSTAAAQFATTLTITGCGNTLTLLAGSRIGVTTSTGAQLLEVVADATSNAGGVMTVEVRAMLRGTVAAASAVVLVQPTALFTLASTDIHWGSDQAGMCQPVTIDLVEVFT